MIQSELHGLSRDPIIVGLLLCTSFVFLKVSIRVCPGRNIISAISGGSGIGRLRITKETLKTGLIKITPAQEHVVPIEPGRLSLGHQSITASPHRDDVFRTGRIELDFLAQIADMHGNRPCIFQTLHAPDDLK